MPDFKHFPLPDVGEGLTEAEILTWQVKVGDTVTVNQVIVEIETAKAAVELPSPYAGLVTQLLAAPGDTVTVGTPIIVIDTDPSGAAPAPAALNGTARHLPEERIANLVGYGPRSTTPTRRRRTVSPEPVAAEPVPVAPAPVAQAPVAQVARPLAKPPVRKLAKELGVDLGSVAGSGAEGVITRDDVARAVTPPAPTPVTTGARRVPIRGVRKATAAAVVSSAFTAPHVTEFVTVDVTPMMELRNRLKSHPDFRDVKLTPLAFAAKAVCLAARRTPDVTAVWDEAAQEIVYPGHLHLGIAAATPRGLIVPKIRHADTLALRDLATALDELTTVARDGKTAPADLVDGTITITNIGVFGIDTGTPIINPGESAILALGAIRDMPWVVDGAVVPRKVCQLALSFDHRVVDGQEGSRFLADVAAVFADPGMAITY
jgi:pyruvate dehydrogenase E2 component (dihydrolipoamide acetyltransferase)